MFAGRSLGGDGYRRSSYRYQARSRLPSSFLLQIAQFTYSRLCSIMQLTPKHLPHHSPVTSRTMPKADAPHSATGGHRFCTLEPRRGRGDSMFSSTTSRFRFTSCGRVILDHGQPPARSRETLRRLGRLRLCESGLLPHGEFSDWSGFFMLVV